MDKQLEFDFEDKPNRLTYEEYFLNKWTEYSMAAPSNTIYYLKYSYNEPVLLTLEQIKEKVLTEIRVIYTGSIGKQINTLIVALRAHLNYILYKFKQEGHLNDYTLAITYNIDNIENNTISVDLKLRMTQSIEYVSVNYTIRV